ncbi:MAG: hypothetical protein ACE5O2_12370 [Armatimonadota bacterium]
MSSNRIVLIEEDFSGLRLGPIRNTYSPWGEYHCRTDQGRLGRWAEATTHYSWRQSGGVWRIAEDAGRRVMEATFFAQHGYPLIVTGDTDWGRYEAGVDVRLLSFAAPCGLVVGYHHSRDFFALLATEDALTLVRRRHDRLTELGRASAQFDAEGYRRLGLRCTDVGIMATLDGETVLEASDVEFRGGLVGLIANAPARFADLVVTTDPEESAAVAARRQRVSRTLSALRLAYPQPKLWRKFSTRGFGTDRNLRIGDVNGDGENEIVLAQPTRYLGSGDYCAIACLTALDLDGGVLWQIGKPTPLAQETTADLCFQVHDIDGDGRAEVIHAQDFRLVIADGANGETRLSVPTPRTSAPRAAGAYPMARVLGDCLYFCDLRGSGRNDSIVLKDRYKQCWVYDASLRLRWAHGCETGHYPAAYDLDGDGREELMMGYTLLSPDGEVLWQLEAVDHADSIVMGPIREGGEPIVAVAGSDAGFFLLDNEGRRLCHHPIGHAQTVCVAKLRADVAGLQIAVNTYWGAPGITLILDAEGNVLDEFEPMHYACLLQPVNWTRDETELVLLSPHPEEGGLIDGHGRRVVMFPDDGHPVLCSDVKDVDGDGIDEILAWDWESIWIYKPHPEPNKSPEDYPLRNPFFNDSNYRGQFSFPRGDRL